MSYGQGSITFEHGKWRVRVPRGNGTHKSIGAFDTEDEARTMRNAALAERHLLDSGITLRHYGDAWFVKIAKQRNLRSWRTTWDTIVLTADFSDQSLPAIARVDVDSWAKSLHKVLASRSVLRNGKRSRVTLKHAISRQTAQHALGLLRRCLASALDDGLVAENVAADVRLPKKAESDDDVDVIAEITYLPEAELEKLLGFDDLPLEQRTVFTISTHQGPREGEIAGLSWERVDWAEHGWWIVKSWNGKTKTGKGRWQALLPRAEAALRLWWEACGRPTAGIMFPSPRLDGEDKPKRYGKGYDWGWADHPEAKLTRLGWWRRAGLKTRVRLHDHRDTAATHLLSGTWGEPWRIEDVSDFLGHSSIEVTRARYAHITRAAARRAAARTVKTPAGNLPGGGGPPPPDSAVISLAPPAGVEPATFGLGRLSSRSDSAGLQQSRQVGGRFTAEAGDLARALLDRAASGAEIPRADVRAFAAAVLDDRATALALEAFGGGERALDAALQLAELIAANTGVAGAARRTS